MTTEKIGVNLSSIFLHFVSKIPQAPTPSCHSFYRTNDHCFRVESILPSVKYPFLFPSHIHQPLLLLCLNLIHYDWHFLKRKDLTIALSFVPSLTLSSNRYGPAWCAILTAPHLLIPIFYLQYFYTGCQVEESIRQGRQLVTTKSSVCECSRRLISKKLFASSISTPAVKLGWSPVTFSIKIQVILEL